MRQHGRVVIIGATIRPCLRPLKVAISVQWPLIETIARRVGDASNATAPGLLVAGGRAVRGVPAKRGRDGLQADSDAIHRGAGRSGRDFWRWRGLMGPVAPGSG